MILLISACSTLQNELKNYVKQPEVTYESISLSEISMEKIVLNPTFNISNKNNFSMPIDKVSYQLSLNNQKMVTGETDKIGTLPANDDKDVTLSLDLNKETLNALQQLLFKDKKLDYQVKGDVTSMGMTIPFEKSATLYIPQIKINDVEVVNASFEHLEIILSVDVENNNSFNLPMETIGYSVSTGGNTLFSGNLENQEIAEGLNTIKLPLTIKPNDLFNNIFNIIANPDLPLHVEVNTPLFNKSFDQSLNIGSLFSL